MEKFKRLNKQTQVEEAYVGAQGTVKSFSATPRANKGTNGKSYHQFTAEIETAPGKTALIGGQVYTGLLEYIGGIPLIGAKMGFSCRIEDLKAGKNGYWGVSGNAIDSVSEDFMAAIDQL